MKCQVSNLLSNTYTEKKMCTCQQNNDRLDLLYGIIISKNPSKYINKSIINMSDKKQLLS